MIDPLQFGALTQISAPKPDAAASDPPRSIRHPRWRVGALVTAAAERLHPHRRSSRP